MGFLKSKIEKIYIFQIKYTLGRIPNVTHSLYQIKIFCITSIEEQIFTTINSSCTKMVSEQKSVFFPVQRTLSISACFSLDR